MPVCAGRQGECRSCEPSEHDDRSFEGLIQHSFALQLSKESRAFRGRTTLERIAKRFDIGEFRSQPVGEIVAPPFRSRADHSPLTKSGLTTLESLTAKFIGPEPPVRKLPDAFKWAEQGKDRPIYEEPRLIFADKFDDDRHASLNDFIITGETDSESTRDISQTLLELMAHKRSRLFGFALANRFVNVALPHAILKPLSGREGGFDETALWFVQPLVSFIRGGRIRSRLRTTYSLTLFLLPVRCCKGSLSERSMTVCEIVQLVNSGWGLAAAPPPSSIQDFKVEGPLLRYLSCLAGFDLHELKPMPTRGHCISNACHPVTVRQASERIAFGVSLSVAQGQTGRASSATARRIGNDVVMSLGSARVSSVVVVDGDLSSCKVKRPPRCEPFPGSLASLMEALGKSSRAPLGCDGKAPKYRLDRPFVDSDLYAIGVLPAKRCTVVVSRKGAQWGVKESALMQAGSVAYMTIGAATAIGTMREIDRRLEHLRAPVTPRRSPR